MTQRILVAALLGATILSGCAEREIILPGDREALRTQEGAAASASEARAIRLPAQKANSTWAGRIGTQGTRVEHAALSAAPKLAWSTKIGTGVSRRERITADPVVADGRIFTIDSQSNIAATKSDGSALWTRNLTPSRETPGDVVGGGLAVRAGIVFASTGYGEIFALDAKTGETVWMQDMDAAGSSSPAVYGDLVYVVAGDDVAWALNAKTGRVAWKLGALPDITSVQSSSAPAITDKFAIFAFGSGEIQGAFRNGGLRLWDASLSGRRDGRAINTVNDVAGDPVVDGDVFYAANNSGRVAAFKVDSGKRLWTADHGANAPVFPAGDSIFLVSERNRLVRIDKSTGDTVWQVEMPLFKKHKRHRTAQFAHYGPVLAGGRLIVASSDGELRSFDPKDGALLSSTSLPDGATTSPVVAGRTLYIVDRRGQLNALR